MSIAPDEVDRIAKLSRLTFNDEEKVKLQGELSSILTYVDQLKEAGGLAEVSLGGNPDARNLMRNDVAEILTDPEEFLAQAPDRQGNFIKVKSVL